MWYYRKRTSFRVRHYGRFFATLASTIWMTVVKTLPLPCIRLFCDMRVPGSTSKVTLLIIFCYTYCPVSWRNGKGREWGRRRESIGRQVELQNKQTVTRETIWMDGTRKNTWKRQARKTIQRRKYFGIKEVDWQLNKMLNLQPLRKPNAGKKKKESRKRRLSCLPIFPPALGPKNPISLLGRQRHPASIDEISV